MKFNFKFLILFLLVSCIITTKAQVVINEICHRNFSTLFDEDGDAEDWIELYNTDDSIVSLNNFFISDDTANIYKWQFPDISISANSFLTFFVSGKNRKQVIDHWETIIFTEDTFKYLNPVAEPDPDWTHISYNDSLWQDGIGGFGFGDGDDNTIICDTLLSVYIRKKFTIPDTSKITNAVLHIDYDDGFVAYLNGKEIVRGNMVNDGKVPPFNAAAFSPHEAQMYQGGLPESFNITSEKLKSLILNGTNVLTIQAHNYWCDNDMSLIPFFSVSINDSSTFFNPIPEWFYADNLLVHTNFKISDNDQLIILSDSLGNTIEELNIPYLQLNTSAGNYPDGSYVIKYFGQPSPGTSNNNSLTYDGVVEQTPVFSLNSGFYSSDQNIFLNIFDTSLIIRYTKDGSIPTDTSCIYLDAINFDSTTVIRARAFKDNYLPGETQTNTYFINDSSSLPVISISTDPYNLWNWDNGIYVMGPNAKPDFPYYGANFWNDWEIPVNIEYFREDGIPVFEQECGMKIHGGWSRAYNLKSFRLLAKSKYGKSTFDYKLFKDKDISDFKRILLRNSGSDFSKAYLRDPLIHKLVQNKTHNDVMDYNPSLVFINGNYWGILNIRERVDKYYLQNNHGISIDNVDILEKQALVVEGSNIQFLSMMDFITSNDISKTENYDSVNLMLDIENFCDYMITELYIINTDWPRNNLKFWKADNYKWRFILFDVDVSMAFWSWNYAYVNAFERILNDTLFYPSLIFQRLLLNQEFKNYFINRYADLMNTIFLPGNFIYHLDTLVDRLRPEMERHKEKWGGNFGSWEQYHINTKIKSFINIRPAFVRENIIEEFDLIKTDTLTFRIDTPNIAKIKINTIIPDTSLWTGIYFDGVPVKIEAIPNPGYHFYFWETSDSAALSDSSRIIYFNSYKNDTITAHFFGYPDTAKIIITEINYKSHPNQNADDWIELYNNDTSVIDLSAWIFKDSEDIHVFEFPANTVLSPQEYLVLVQDTGKFSWHYPEITNYIGPFDFGLSSNGEQLRLYDDLGHLNLLMVYSPDPPWPGGTNGSGRTLELIDYNGDMNNGNNWKQGCFGGSPGQAYFNCINPARIIITEINYRSSTASDAGDWIELFNNDTVNVDMSKWIFKDDEDEHIFEIPENTILQIEEYLVLTQDTLDFSNIYPDISNYLGSFNFGLSSNGDSLQLFDKFYQPIVTIYYSPEPPWPPNTNGTGRTIEIIDYNGDLNDGSNWKTGCIKGSPGQAFFPCDTNSVYEFILNEKQEILSCFPNPFTNLLSIRINQKKTGETRLYLMDKYCREIETIYEKKLSKGIYNFEYHPDNILPGIYYLIFISSGETLMKKIIFIN
ncbi:MAG: lamin tail domain-containing protein [Bacteroidales bacterium]|nr:lamin tail domain-containing protein [Bacteroidales bacterium]